MSNTFFAYLQHNKMCFFPLKKIIFIEMMFTADPWEKPGWIILSGKIIPEDTIQYSLAQGIHNRLENLSPLGPWFHSGSEWESKDIINIGWAGKWPYWSKLKGADILSQTAWDSELTSWPMAWPFLSLFAWAQPNTGTYTWKEPNLDECTGHQCK